MKKFLDLGSLAVIALALILIGYLYFPQRSSQAANSTAAFKEFPVGQSRVINLSARSEALEELSPRERLDQMRDWLLFTAVSSSGLPAEAVNKALFDLPPIRHGYMQPVANFEYGDTRSCYIGNGQVLALVPADTSAERDERLARIADEQRKNLGEMPTKLLVFDYELKPADDPTQQTAMLTRRNPVSVKDLFTSSAGYYEAKINSLDDLNRFMVQVDDLTYASLKDGLTVGGRKIKGHKYRGIRVEEIAALYQSESKIRGNRSALKQKIEAFNNRWENRTYETEAEKAQLLRQYEQEEAALKEDLREARRAGGLVGSSGFSLDPTFDFAKLAAKFDSTIGPGIRSILSDGSLSDSQESTQDSSALPELRGMPGAGDSVEQKIKLAREGLANHDPDPLFELLGEVANKGERGKLIAHLIEEAIGENYGYQAARYDGELQGTEAGMVLFYTDLLAKLWAMNYQSSAPANDITEFHPMTALPVSSVYKQEIRELSNTRLWFGPQDRGFQVADKGQSMLFARTATRVYAASSNSLKPGIEAQPNAESAAFLGWWDNHYDEIARFEPEYERLNEIMKWSLVVTWLNQREQTTRLGFLQGVPVEHGNWFPDWVKQRPELRYTAWDKVGFYQRGANNTKTESLPHLKSETYRQFGNEAWLIGGVSLASEETIAGRAALSAESEVAQLARRSNLNYALGESTGSALKTLEGTTYRFASTSAEEAITTATAKQGAKMRGLYGEIANNPVARNVSHSGEGLNIGTRVGEVPLGDLNISSAENGFRVGWTSRDIDVGTSLSRRLSMSVEPAKALALDPSVEAAIKLPGNQGFMVKLEGSERWLRITPEGAQTTSLESGYAARVGNFDARAQNYNLNWVKPEDVSNSLREGSALRLRKVANADGRYEMEIGALEATGEPISIEHAGTTVRGRLNQATGELSFAYEELPQALRNDPSLLRRLVAEVNPSPGVSIYRAGDLNRSGLIESLRRGDFRTAARDLAQAPDDFKAQLELNLSRGVNECNGMLRNQEYQMASRRAEELIQLYGPRDELRLRKLAADLTVPDSTHSSLAELAAQGNRPSMFDEFSARLNDTIPLGRRKIGEGINLLREGDDLAVRYDLSNLDSGVPLAPGEPNRIKAFIYVEDTPGLNNLDWQVSPQRTLEAAISGQFKARVIKLPRGDVASFKPSVIYDKAAGLTFKAVNTGGTGGGFRQPRYFVGNGNPAHFLLGDGFNPRGYRRPFVPCIDDDDDEDNRANNDDDNCDDEDRDTQIVIVRQ
ncbi:MAG TPA: hypothetical protein VM911_11875 [Pyrinomonadaceae bacterium]|nr:hypothetical protein [Pyrinomonadaceae bacterium]